jgi:hypothetical protein
MNKQIKDYILVHDHFEWTITRNGKVRTKGCSDDLISKYGMAQLAALCGAIGSPVAFGYVGIGSGSTGETVNDSALQTLIKIKAVTPTRIDGAYTNTVIQWVTTFSSSDGLSGSIDWTEVGVMTAATAYILLMHKVQTAETLNWTAGDVLNLTVTVEFGQG